VVLPIALPLGAAALSMALGRWPWIRQYLGLSALAATILVSVGLLTRVADGTVLVLRLGGWESTVGIVLVVDLFSAIMLVVSTVMLLVVLIYAIGSPRTNVGGVFFQP